MVRVAAGIFGMVAWIVRAMLADFDAPVNVGDLAFAVGAVIGFMMINAEGKAGRLRAGEERSDG